MEHLPRKAAVNKQSQPGRTPAWAAAGGAVEEGIFKPLGLCHTNIQGATGLNVSLAGFQSCFGLVLVLSSRIEILYALYLGSM